ncbi:MAG: ATP-dependent Clp protease ATP-binding subunit, partial [Clostridia bacterium]|nr:ATP-dependent Clp protease ATP-binding subunit [Clostridia bacterium]
NNPLLIGEPGTGKTAVVEGLAKRIASGEVPVSLKNKILFSLDLGGMVAGAKYKGELEGRFKEMLKFVEESGNIIVFIDEIHNLVSGAKSDGMDASEIMKPALARGEIQVIGATTIDEYRLYIEKDKALERRFSIINVEPPSVEDSIKIITGLKDAFEAHHCVTIMQEAIVAAVKLSDRYITDRFLPDKAVDIIDEAAARARLSMEAIDTEMPLKEEEARRIDYEIDYARSCGRDYSYLEQKLVEINAEIDRLHEKQIKLESRKSAYIDADDVARVIADMTNIPVARLNETERQRFLNLENVLHRRVIGQNGAVRCVSQAIRRAMSGINDPKKPNGVFLFVGPTGVGKTELAKALSEALFADENTLIRIDMGEYMDKASITRLIGAPPGYVGYEEEGQLTEKVRRKPYSVVLFDEIEKAHPEIFNIMLQIFDDGRLTDSKGRLIDFKNTVIILTSNEGAADIERFKKEGKISSAEVTEAYENALRRKFKPEFLNRIDQIVCFENLSRSDGAKICALIIDGLVKRLADKNIYLTYDDGVLDLIVARGYSNDYGARPLKRAVCSSIEDEIAERIMTGEITEGCHVFATADNGEIKFIVE